MIDKTGADPYGDERVKLGCYRWNKGDRVMWQTRAGWRSGEVAHCTNFSVQVIDWQRRDVQWIAPTQLYRNYPRED